jgi:hypothetical protein
MRRDSCDVDGARCMMDHEQHVVRDQAMIRPNVNREEVGCGNDVSV